MLSQGHTTIHTIGINATRPSFLTFFGEIEEFCYTKSKLYLNEDEAKYKLKILQNIGAVHLRVLSYRVEARHIFINQCAETFYKYLGYYRELTEQEYQAMTSLYYKDKKKEEFITIHQKLITASS